MATFGERLKEALDKRNLSAAELSRRTGISEGMISQYKSGAYVAKQKKLELFSKALNVSIPWLMGQDVPMELNSLPTDAVPYNPVIHEIPILGYISAGLPLYAEEHVEGYTYTDRNGGAEYFALRVKGDSMSAANINDGSLLIVRRQERVENGEIAVVMVNKDNATVKRFKQDGNAIQLIPQSYNPQHQIQIYDLNKDSIKVLGKVVECKIEF